MNNEEVLFVIFDRKLDFSQLNEVHKHKKMEENNTVTMDQKSNRSSRPIRLPKEEEKRLIMRRKQTFKCFLHRDNSENCRSTESNGVNVDR